MSTTGPRRRGAVPTDGRITAPERAALVLVVVLALVGSVGVIGYGLSHALVRADPALGAPGAGGPPTVDDASPTGSTTPTPAPRATASATPATPRPTTVVIPAQSVFRFRTNTVGAGTTAGGGRVITFDVHVQKGLPYDANEVGREIATTLNDPRSWRADGRQRFRLVTHDAELHAYLVTPGTTDRLCRPLLTKGEVSCQQGDKVVLNARRWAFAVPEYAGQVPVYRQYLVNHEFGHYLGNGHVGCPGRGRVAPVMMQQTYGLNGCRANAWPYPKG